MHEKHKLEYANALAKEIVADLNLPTEDVLALLGLVAKMIVSRSGEGYSSKDISSMLLTGVEKIQSINHFSVSVASIKPKSEPSYWDVKQAI